MLNYKVLPFFEEQEIDLLRVLTDRGTEYLNIEDVEHTKTKANSPQTNGICERFHKTALFLNPLNWKKVDKISIEI
ncbi:putative iSSod13, transposase [Francisella sp. TX07-6608]|nr:putative iSSod13, transposase [Francisella sp. TX07-6608]